MTAEQIRAALSDWQALTITLYGECAAEPIEGKVAVGCAIRNRLRSARRFGTSYRSVCHQRAQFSCWWKFGGIANYTRVMALAECFAAGRDLPLDGMALRALQECGFVAEGIIGEQLLDRVGSATHYYAPAAMVPKGRVPDWASGKKPTATVGQHLFFAGIA